MILLKPKHQLAKFMIGISDLAIVRMTLILRSKRFRSIVWAMRIIKMQPQKKRPSRRLLQPPNGVRHTLPCATVHQTDIFFFKSLCRKRVVVKSESARQSPTPVKNERADHSSGSVTRLLKSLRHR